MDFPDVADDRKKGGLGGVDMSPRRAARIARVALRYLLEAVVEDAEVRDPRSVKAFASAAKNVLAILERVDRRFAPVVSRTGALELAGPPPRELSEKAWKMTQEIYEEATREAHR